MSEKKSRFLESVYFKIAFGAVLAFIGVAAGVYVGFGLSGRSVGQPEGLPLSQEDFEANADYVRFQQGELFPLEPCREADGNETNFEQVLFRQPTVVLFESMHCGRCRDLLEFWQANLAPVLRPDVQVVACFDRYGPELTEEYAELLAGIRVVFYDEKRFHEEYGLDTFPSIVGIDASGFIQHFQIGFPSAVDRELWKMFTAEGI
jgi:hypothetical protein